MKQNMKNKNKKNARENQKIRSPFFATEITEVTEDRRRKTEDGRQTTDNRRIEGLKMRRQMIEDISLKNDDRKNRSRRAGKPRPYLNIKDLISDRDYKGLIYFCQGRGEVSSPALPNPPFSSAH